MGIFGWSLPPGCGTLPGEEEGATDLTHLIPELPHGAYVYWLEDGTLVAQVGSDRELRLSVVEWDDEQTDEQNFARAAAVVVREHLSVIAIEREHEAHLEQAGQQPDLAADLEYEAHLAQQERERAEAEAARYYCGRG